MKNSKLEKRDTLIALSTKIYKAKQSKKKPAKKPKRKISKRIRKQRLKTKIPNIRYLYICIVHRKKHKNIKRTLEKLSHHI